MIVRSALAKVGHRQTNPQKNALNQKNRFRAFLRLQRSEIIRKVPGGISAANAPEESERSLLLQSIGKLGAGDAEQPGGCGKIPFCALDCALEQGLLEGLQIDSTVEYCARKVTCLAELPCL